MSDSKRQQQADTNGDSTPSYAERTERLQVFLYSPPLRVAAWLAAAAIASQTGTGRELIRVLVTLLGDPGP